MGTSFDAVHPSATPYIKCGDLQRTFRQDLSRLLLRDTLDLLEYLSGRIRHRLDRVVPAIYEELDVALRETCDALEMCISDAACLCWEVLRTSS